jgi:catechol 2,3-dioxygenase
MRTSSEFAANPIGVFFDPEHVFDAHRAGWSPADIRRAAMAGEYLPDPLPQIGVPPKA